MKTLQTLIKINKNNVNIIKKDITYLSLTQEQLEEEIEEIKNTYNNEVGMYLGTDFTYQISLYKLSTEKAIEERVQKIKEIKEKLTLLQENLIEAHTEQRKFEFLLENKIKQKKLKLSKNEEKELNDYIIMRYNHNKD